MLWPLLADKLRLCTFYDLQSFLVSAVAPVVALFILECRQSHLGDLELEEVSGYETHLSQVGQIIGPTGISIMERLLSTDGQILSTRRLNKLSDGHFEMIILLRNKD